MENQKPKIKMSKPFRKFLKFLGYGCVLYVLLIVLIIFLDSTPSKNLRSQNVNQSKMEQKNIRDEKIRQETWIFQSQQAIKRKLKDPGSAQFRNVYFSRAGGAPVACGEVNSRNSYGGMSGFQGFVAAGDSGLAFLQEEVDDFAAVWSKMCAGTGSP